MTDMSRHSRASLAGLVTVHSSVFRHTPLMKTYVRLNSEHGVVVAERFGQVKIPVISEDKHWIEFEMARLLDGKVHVKKVVGNGHISYLLSGDVDNPFNRGWFRLGRQTYHYRYDVNVDLVVAVLPAYGTA